MLTECPSSVPCSRMSDRSGKSRSTSACKQPSECHVISRVNISMTIICICFRAETSLASLCNFRRPDAKALWMSGSLASVRKPSWCIRAATVSAVIGPAPASSIAWRMHQAKPKRFVCVRSKPSCLHEGRMLMSFKTPKIGRSAIAWYWLLQGPSSSTPCLCPLRWWQHWQGAQPASELPHVLRSSSLLCGGFFRSTALFNCSN